MVSKPILSPIKTRTFHFRSEFLSCTKTQRVGRGRMFACHTSIDIGIVSAHEVRLKHIETLPMLRRNGYGSDAVEWLCELADEYQVEISLCPCSFDPAIDDIRLTAWYQKFGFVRLGIDNEMIRYPKEWK